MTLILLASLALASCGSKKSPTGGAVDTDRPTVLTTFPAQYGQLENGRIEINFSKSLDKSSVTQAVYVYPPVLDKKVTVDKSTLSIVLNEELLPDTNYYVTLSTRLKDIRGNALQRSQTLVFAHGKLHQNRIAGTIAYEDKLDQGLPLSVNLLSADSLIVLNTQISGGAYAIDGLNPASYLLRAYIDKNKNGRYDLIQDPWFETSVNARQSVNVDMYLAYADTSKAVIRKASPVSRNEVAVSFSEPVANYGAISLKRVKDNAAQPVLLAGLEGDRLTLLTAELDTTLYALEVRNIEDLKGNLNTLGAIRFRGTDNADETPPQVLSASPRNGASVNSLQPVLELRFSELIPAANLQAVLRLADGNDPIPLRILDSDGFVYRFQPVSALYNYRPCLLSVAVSDLSGNKLEYQLNFLPLKRE